MEGFLVTEYLGRYVVDVATAVTLGYKLQTVARPGLSVGVGETYQTLQVSHRALETGWRHQQAQVIEDKRPVYHAVRIFWTALVGRVEHYRVLPPERYPWQPDAVRLYALLAPDGLEVLKLPYPTLWTTLHTRLGVVEDEKLSGALREVAGDAFVIETEGALDDLGRALGITAAPEVPSEDNLRELTRAFMRSVSDYALQVLATARREKPETLQVAHTVLRPIADLRATLQKRLAVPSADGTTTDEPSEPTDAQPVDAQPAEPAPAKPVETPTVPRASLPPPKSGATPPN